jgi:hypothetical protein
MIRPCHKDCLSEDWGEERKGQVHSDTSGLDLAKSRLPVGASLRGSSSVAWKGDQGPKIEESASRKPYSTFTNWLTA